MFALTLVFLIFTNAQYISNSSGLYIWEADTKDIKNLLTPQTTIYLFGTLRVNCIISFNVNNIIMKDDPNVNYSPILSIQFYFPYCIRKCFLTSNLYKYPMS